MLLTIGTESFPYQTRGIFKTPSSTLTNDWDTDVIKNLISVP